MSSVQWRERGCVCEQQNQRLDKESAIVCVCVCGGGGGDGWCVCVWVGDGWCVCVCGWVFVCHCLYSNQSFYRLTAGYWIGGGA